MDRVRAHLLVAALLTVAPVAACTLDAVPPEVDAGERRKPAWSVEVPADLGRPQLAQVAGDAVVVQGESGVVVLARSDGAVRWQRLAPAAVATEVVAVTGTTMVVRNREHLALVDLTTGTERGTVRSASPATLWSGTVGLHSPAGGGCASRWTPRVAADRVLTTGTGGALQVLDPTTGAAWNGPATGTTARPGTADTYPLTATADTVLGRQKAGDLVAFDAATGAERWRLALPDRNDSGFATVNREYAATGDAFVVAIDVVTGDASNPARVTVVDARTGKVRWSAPVGGNLLGASPDGVVTWTDPRTVGYFA